MPLDDLFNKIEAIERFDVQKETIDIINENGEYLVELLKSQLSAGKDGDNKPVTIFGRDFYSDRTIFEKRNKGGLSGVTDWITNYDTGSFYASIYSFGIGQEFVFDSDVPHFPDIIKQSTDRIMRLNEENLIKFRDVILFPQLQARFKAKFNGL